MAQESIAALRINIGCGQTPTPGWRNFDNSIALRIPKLPFLPELLLKLRLIGQPQYQFVRFAQENQIEYGDVARGLPLQDGTVEILYSSHMLEHLDRNEADRFLREAFRLLCPGGIIRIAVPDLKKQIEQYDQSGDADRLIESTNRTVSGLVTRIQFSAVGAGGAEVPIGLNLNVAG